MEPRLWVAGPVLATAAYLALITALANASGIAYLLFPELGALGSVVFSDPRGSWARSPLLLATALGQRVGVGCWGAPAPKGYFSRFCFTPSLKGPANFRI